jgi:redox-sensitive bicupin YhaK (pirin superfamily)
MTAASGLVHEEFHGRDFARRGGRFEMVQLWVNLPAKDKMAPPGYQGILDAQIPAVRLPENRGTVRVIAGEFSGAKGPAKTFTPIQVLDLRLDSEQPIELAVPDGWTAALAVLSGTVRVHGSDPIGSAQVALFDRAVHNSLESATGVRRAARRRADRQRHGSLRHEQQEIRQASTSKRKIDQSSASCSSASNDIMAVALFGACPAQVI